MPLLAVNHHYYRPMEPGRGIYPTSPALMAENIALLRANGWVFGGEQQISDYLAGNAQQKICIITLDDGLREQMQCLADLETLGVPALFFVSTAPVIERRVLDVHKLHMIRSVMEDGELGARLNKLFGMEKHAFDDAVLATQYRYDDPISRRVKYFLNFVLAAEVKDDFISALFTELHGDEKAAAHALYMSCEDWKTLAAKGYLGTHGHRHVPLATLSAEAMRDDICLSLSTLREATGRDVKGISYPFGGKTAVSDAVFSASRALGLTYGFTMQRSVNPSPVPSDTAMQLQRIDVNDLVQYIA